MYYRLVYFWILLEVMVCSLNRNIKRKNCSSICRRKWSSNPCSGTPAGEPEHGLRIKVGTVLMLLINLSVS